MSENLDGILNNVFLSFFNASFICLVASHFSKSPFLEFIYSQAKHEQKPDQIHVACLDVQPTPENSAKVDLLADVIRFEAKLEELSVIILKKLSITSSLE